MPVTPVKAGGIEFKISREESLSLSVVDEIGAARKADQRVKTVLGSPMPPPTAVPCEKGVSISSLNPPLKQSRRDQVNTLVQWHPHRRFYLY